MAQELTFASTLHLAAVLPAVVVGVAQLASTKGTRLHKVLGWVWVVLMTVTAVSSFWISGINNAGGFSWIHALSVFVLFNLVCAVWAARRGNIRAHKKFMVGTMIGVIAAGIGALMPGRFLAQLLF